MKEVLSYISIVVEVLVLIFILYKFHAVKEERNALIHGGLWLIAVSVIHKLFLVLSNYSTYRFVYLFLNIVVVIVNLFIVSRICSDDKQGIAIGAMFYAIEFALDGYFLHFSLFVNGDYYLIVNERYFISVLTLIIMLLIQRLELLNDLGKSLDIVSYGGVLILGYGINLLMSDNSFYYTNTLWLALIGFIILYSIVRNKIYNNS